MQLARRRCAAARLLAACVMAARTLAVSILAAGLAAAPALASDEPAALAFKRLDLNGDGVVSFDEFVRASDARLEGMDRNADGNIGRDEFVAFHAAEEERRVGRIFAALDKQRTGKVLAAQISAARLGESEARRLLACDLDKDGAITRTEYLECRRRVAERWMQRIFAKYDKNGDGFIGRDERIAALRDFFDRLDANGDGKVERAEFAAARQRWAERRSRAAAPPSGDAPSSRASQPGEFD